jgi:hypothetical protein
MKILIKKQTLFNGKVFRIDEEVNISDDIGARWCKNGICTEIEEPKKEVKKEELKIKEGEENGISSLCGDSGLGGFSGGDSGKPSSRFNKAIKKGK